jgi:DNA mismatch repair protein MSH2
LSLFSDYEEKQTSLVSEVLETCNTYCSVIEKLSKIIAEVDIIYSFATVASTASTPYCVPEITSNELYLKNARHPTLELQPDVNFIPNDVHMIRDRSEFILITGANAGGKSTYIRSVGIIAIMAQIGCFVPCELAKVPIFDSLFTRVGAEDIQLKGISTFMAEMIETSSILKNCTHNSLVIIDELGRGTSTYDGFGLAWSIVSLCTKFSQRPLQPKIGLSVFLPPISMN